MRPPKSPCEARPSTLAWWSRQAIVYFIAAGSPPTAIKIGMTTLRDDGDLRESVRRRLVSIQSSNHELIELLGILRFTEGDFPGRDAEMREREVHLRFDHLARFKAGARGAEWFTATPEILAAVDVLAVKPEAAGVPRFASARR